MGGFDLQKPIPFQANIKRVGRKPQITLSQVGFDIFLKGAVKSERVLLEPGGTDVGKVVGNNIKPAALNKPSSNRLIDAYVQSTQPPF